MILTEVHVIEFNCLFSVTNISPCLSSILINIQLSDPDCTDMLETTNTTLMHYSSKLLQMSGFLITTQTLTWKVHKGVMNFCVKLKGLIISHESHGPIYKQMCVFLHNVLCLGARGEVNIIGRKGKPFFIFISYFQECLFHWVRKSASKICIYSGRK